MLELTETQIRRSFVNASRKEVSDLALPLEFADTDWERLDFYGWRDRKAPRRAYAIIPLNDVPVGILFRQAEAVPRSRAQCSWCQDVNLTNDVVFYSAKRAGDAGRKGDTIGSLICADFGCSKNVRMLPPVAYVGFDVHAARDARIADLRSRVGRFAEEVRGDSLE